MMAENSPDDTLPAALRRHGIELPDEQVARLDQYARLLWEWNEKLNLTRHTDYEKFVSRDVVDSLAVAQFLQPGERVLDVGTGGGVPGVILAIVRPDLKVAMCESVAKKARVVDEIVARLGLKARVHHARAEALLAQHKYDTLVIRAVAPLRKLLEWFKPHVRRFGRMLVLKGPSWVEERGEARHVGLMHAFTLRKLHEYPLPGTTSHSVLLSLAPRAGPSALTGPKAGRRLNQRLKKQAKPGAARKPPRRPGGGQKKRPPTGPRKRTSRPRRSPP